MILSVVKAALSSVYGAERVDNEVSGYYVADEISGTYRGMIIAIRDEEWEEFRNFLQSVAFVQAFFQPFQKRHSNPQRFTKG